jgi:ribosomal protein RSM22 (predicted rRNA methylase)
MRSARLPDQLREALEREAEDLRPGEVIRCARMLSERYRAGLPVRLDSIADRLAYALTRMPATYGALRACFSELPFVPGSLLDLGAGPGTALWAFQSQWGAPAQATCVELNGEWQPLAARLETPEAVWRRADLRALPELPAHDLTVCSYALNELSTLERGRLVERAWATAGRALLLVEPGTPAGFETIRTARRWLTEAGASIAAPCPHDQACPMSADDWCHFAVRVERTRLHRLAKGGDLGYEDEKFSYVLALREPAAMRPARILRHPRVDAGRIELKLCAVGGLESRTVTKREKQDWKHARKASWGDRWESGKSDEGDK